MFKIGDKIVYPMHGAGTIEAIEKKDMMGSTQDYYIIKMPIGDMKLMVPTNKANDIGVREVSTKNISDQVFSVLQKPKAPYVHDSNWSKRYNMNVDKIKSGNILDVAEVVRDLSHRHMERGLSIGEKKMLATAKDILISEMVLSEGMAHDTLDNIIEDTIKSSYSLNSDANINNGQDNNSNNVTNL